MNDTVTNWITGYRRAWESNEPDDIRALFTEDATYRTEPYAEPWRGHDDIVTEWLAERDEPEDTSFAWVPLVVTDQMAIVQGTTVYLAGSTFSNLWVIRFAADGRAREFTEWWMKYPEDDE